MTVATNDPTSKPNDATSEKSRPHTVINTNAANKLNCVDEAMGQIELSTKQHLPGIVVNVRAKYIVSKCGSHSSKVIRVLGVPHSPGNGKRRRNEVTLFLDPIINATADYRIGR